MSKPGNIYKRSAIIICNKDLIRKEISAFLNLWGIKTFSFRATSEDIPLNNGYDMAIVFESPGFLKEERELLKAYFKSNSKSRIIYIYDHIDYCNAILKEMGPVVIPIKYKAESLFITLRSITDLVTRKAATSFMQRIIKVYQEW